MELHSNENEQVETGAPVMRLPESPISKIVEPESEIRKLLNDQQTSRLRKYMWLTLGESSILRLIQFEVLTMLLAGLRGAIGILLRQTFYRGLFRKCGRGVVIGRNVTIRNPCRICIGDNVVIDDNVVLDAKGDADETLTIGSNSIIGRNSILVCKGGKIVIEPEVNISVNCTIISESKVTIGEKSLVGGHCYIIAGGNHGTQLDGVPFVDQPRKQKGGVTMLRNCWLGASTTILDGTTIGPDAVVGAAALVRRNVPEKTIVAGVPAEIISSVDLPVHAIAH